MVHIERLECKGFKSFGRKKVSIKFSPGFTCIVGPNGSGKSNVVDAILFVLGQLSAKTLRANVFADLLYSPPKPNMPPEATSATVKLHFNNRDRKLQVESDKVVIERELDESGRSTCRINGKVVTRSTVVDILGGIGVDPNGYNLVLQGEIAQIVKASPTQRRELIEEIAGISAYDEQKEKALKKLTESENNLGKVEMQLRERQRQLDKLEEERGDALQYQKTRQLKRETRIDSLAWSIVKSESRIETIKETLAEKAEEFEQLEKELQQTIQKIERTEEEIEKIDDEIDQIAGEDSARISERFGIVSAAVEHLMEELDEANRNLNAAKAEKEKKEEKLGRIRDEIQELNQKYEQGQNQLQDVTNEVSSLETKVNRLEDKFEKEQSNYYRNTQELQQFNNK
ncbi:MAG: AAA family ATPase, partial [Promethearchaeia archaeon]